MNVLDLAEVKSSTRTKSEALARRILVIPDDAQRLSSAQAQRAFSLAMVLSGLRCLLTYVVLPVLLPLAGAAAGVEPVVGVPIAALALVFDVRGIRRVWLANGRHRWSMTVLYLGVMGLVVFLMVHDLLVLAH